MGARFGNKAKVDWSGFLVGDKLLIVNAGSTASSVLPSPWWA
ncbi:MAG: hypothetical protein WAV38_09265 [Xanthobacteraceae bacterium]